MILFSYLFLVSIYSDYNNKSTKSPYFKEIDGLRAFAIITVIINHLNKNFMPGGYLGVDIFFVISGFVITSSLNGRTSTTFKEFIKSFYARRCKRLLPALIIFVLAISIMVCLFNPYPSVALKTGLTSLFGISNLYLLKQSTDYFAQSTQLNVFTHTWSLGVEEQFYLIFPFLVWFTGFGRKTKKGSRNLFLVLGGITITSLFGFTYLYPNNQAAAYFLMPTRFWEMASGCLLFLFIQRRKKIKKILKLIPSFLLLILIVLVMYLPSSFATTSTLIVVSLTCLLIGSLQKQTLIYNALTYPKFTYIGRISYSLYLWHWGILSLSRWTIGIHWWSLPFQIILIFGMAIVSFEWIEKPFRNRVLVKSPSKFSLFITGILATVSLILFTLGRPLKGKLYTGDAYNKFNIKGFGEAKIINDLTSPTMYLIGDSHAGHYGAVMSYLSEKKDFNFIMHPQGSGLNLINNSTEEQVLAPLRQYKNKFKKRRYCYFLFKHW